MPAISQNTSECQAHWAEITEAVGPLGQVIPVTGITAGKNGWCEIAVDNLASLGMSLDEAQFRLDQMPEPVAGGRAIEVALSGLRTPVGTFDGTAALGLDVENGAVRLQQLELHAPDGRGLRATADLRIAALTGIGGSPETETNRVSVDLVVTPEFTAATSIDFSEVTRTAVDNALRGISDAQISAKSQREFLRFIGAALNARGTLSVAGEGAGDVTIFQILRPFLALGRNPSDAAISAAFNMALEGVTLDLTWKPGRM